MKKLIIGLLFGLFSLSAMAADVTLTWTAPTQYEDNTPLPQAEISGFNIYYSQSSGGPYDSSVISIDAAARTQVVTGLAPGTWYFVATTVATNGLESVYSDQAIKVILTTARPKAPIIILLQ